MVKIEQHFQVNSNQRQLEAHTQDADANIPAQAQANQPEQEATAASRGRKAAPFATAQYQVFACRSTCVNRPASSSKTRSHCSCHSGSWVTESTVRVGSEKTSNTACLLSTSSALVTSSSRYTFLPNNRPRASAIRCFSPPEIRLLSWRKISAGSCSRCNTSISCASVGRCARCALN